MTTMNLSCPARILIVGDVMLDRYWFGEVNRISPEAPVPVVRVERREERLGGAANVARNAATLGAPAGRRIAANQSHAAAPNSEGLLVKIGFVSIMTGLLATMMFGFVLLLLR